MSIIGTLFEG
ncbi:hypothetical protein D046_5425A, partial [Vibrio parahaemolyticus V-223/04]